MKFEIVTLFPELIEVYKKNGIIGRAVENKLFEIEYVPVIIPKINIKSR